MPVSESVPQICDVLREKVGNMVIGYHVAEGPWNLDIALRKLECQICKLTETDLVVILFRVRIEGLENEI